MEAPLNAPQSVLRRLSRSTHSAGPLLVVIMVWMTSIDTVPKRNLTATSHGLIAALCHSLYSKSISCTPSYGVRRTVPNYVQTFSTRAAWSVKHFIGRGHSAPAFSQHRRRFLVWLRRFHVMIPRIATMKSAQNNQLATRQVVLAHSLASGIVDSAVLGAMSIIIEEKVQL